MVARRRSNVKDTLVGGPQRAAESNRNGWWATHRPGRSCPVPTK